MSAPAANPKIDPAEKRQRHADREAERTGGGPVTDTPDQAAVLDARAGSAIARIRALEELHTELRRILLRRARRGAPRGRDWRAVERLVAAVGGGPTEGTWRPGR